MTLFWTTAPGAVTYTPVSTCRFAPLAVYGEALDALFDPLMVIPSITASAALTVTSLLPLSIEPPVGTIPVGGTTTASARRLMSVPLLPRLGPASTTDLLMVNCSAYVPACTWMVSPLLALSMAR